MSAAIQELRNYLQAQIEGELHSLVKQFGSFRLDATSRTDEILNAAIYKHGLEVYGMAVRPDELEITFELGRNYLEIPNLPIRYCRITLANDGNYYVYIDEDDLENGLFVSVEDGIFNFAKCSEDEKFGFVDEIKKVHQFYLLAHFK